MSIKYLAICTVFILSNQVCIDKYRNQVDWFLSFLIPNDSWVLTEVYYAYIDNKSKVLDIFKYEPEIFPPQMMMQEGKDLIEWNHVTSKGFIRTYGDKYGVVMSTLGNLNDIKIDSPHSFFCFSVNKNNAVKFLLTLKLLNIQLGSQNENDLMAYVSFLTRENPAGNISEQITRIQTIDKLTLTLFTKTALTDELPFEYMIRNYYQEGFYIKNSRYLYSNLPKNCDKEDMKLLNIYSVRYGPYKILSEKDNGKWAVSILKNTCCIGDLDQDKNSSNKGGNTICFKYDKLADILKNLIQESEDCDRDLDDHKKYSEEKESNSRPRLNTHTY